MAAGWKRVKVLRGHEEAVGRFSWSPDGRSLATPSADGRLVIWDTRTTKPRVERDIGRPAAAAAWSRDGRSLAIAVEDNPVFDYDFEDAEFETTESRGEEDELLRTFEKTIALPGEGEAEALGHDGPMHLRVLDTESGLQVAALGSPSIHMGLEDVRWLEGGDEIVTASAEGLAIWHARDGNFLGWLVGSRGEYHRSVLALPGDVVIGSSSEGESLSAWDAGSREVVHAWQSIGRVRSAAWSPQANSFACGNDLGLVEVFGGQDGRERHTLEGHAGPVTGVSFSADGTLLATAGGDGVRIWRSDDWTLLSEGGEPTAAGGVGAVAFSPVDPTLLVARGRRNTEVVLWELDQSTLAARQDRPGTVHYTNAKVVLVGDTGVGKSGLGLVLAGKKFEATDSTHQRNIWKLGEIDTTGDQPERREVFLWDLAGQPGYRLLHQLHLSDVSVALVVFDARNELDPMAGVRYWCRALEQASRLSKSAASFPRILVAARMDRGGAKVSDDELAAIRRKFGLQQYVATSAKEGSGVETLKETIAATIDWDSLPKVSSTGLFDSIRSFLAAKRGGNLVLTTESELRDAFLATGAAPAEDVLEEFRVCIERVEARGLLRRLTFGDLILLQPEVLDAYAAAVINAAANQPDGLGAIGEADVRDGKFDVPSESRLDSPDTEKLLLIATIEDLLQHEVALREDSGEGSYLVFPTQTSKKLVPGGKLHAWCWFEFEGPIGHVWATLVVRLSHSGVFSREEVGLDVATFRGLAQPVGIRLDQLDEGHGKLELLSEGGDSATDVRLLLEGFVRAHLHRRAIEGSVKVKHVISCEKCQFSMPDELLKALEGEKSLCCPKCGVAVALGEPRAAGDREKAKNGIAKLQRSADKERTRVAARTSVQGKEQIHDFDAFLAHNSRDKEVVSVLAERLRDEGLNPWLDSEQIPPGRWFQEIIQDAIGRVGAAVILIGRHGLGRWETLELRSFVSQCIERDIPVIPTLLPEGKIPDDALFLRELQVVRFKKSINEIDPFANLVWGITQDQDERARLLTRP